MLIPEVRKLLNEGGLNPIDADWISRLKPESQLAAARKCMAPSFTPLATDNPKSSVTHGSPCTQPRRK